MRNEKRKQVRQATKSVICGMWRKRCGSRNSKFPLAYGNRVGCGPAVLNVAHDPPRARRARSFTTDHGDHRPSAQPVPLGAILMRRPDAKERENLKIVLIGYVNGTVTKGGGF